MDSNDLRDMLEANAAAAAQLRADIAERRERRLYGRLETWQAPAREPPPEPRRSAGLRDGSDLMIQATKLLTEEVIEVRTELRGALDRATEMIAEEIGAIRRDLLAQITALREQVAQLQGEVDRLKADNVL